MQLLHRLVYSRGWQAMAHGLNPTHEPFLLIKFYWQTATAIDWCIVCGCFRTTAAELNSYGRDQMAQRPEIFAVCPLVKRPLTPDCLSPCETSADPWLSVPSWHGKLSVAYWVITAECEAACVVGPLLHKVTCEWGGGEKRLKRIFRREVLN